jgi:chitinase
LCSFAFATIDPTTFEVKATSEEAQDLMQRIGGIRLLQPDIKISIAIGGWTFSDADQRTAKIFSVLSLNHSSEEVCRLVDIHDVHIRFG